MKNIVPILLSMLLAIDAGAQHPVTSVQSCPDNIKIKYVLQGEKSTFVFATYTKQSEDQSEICLSRKTVACNEDENFKLLEAYSMPVSDEADEAYILLDQIGQRLNFVLEFEKIPLDRSFDIRTLDFEGRSDANDEYYMKSNSALGKVGSVVNHETWQHDYWSWERTGLEVLGAIIAEENERSIQPYRDRLDAARKEGVKDYLQSQSIAAGDSYSGFIKLKRIKKQKSAIVNIIIDGMNCKTDWNISK